MFDTDEYNKIPFAQLTAHQEHLGSLEKEPRDCLIATHQESGQNEAFDLHIGILDSLGLHGDYTWLSVAYSPQHKLVISLVSVHAHVDYRTSLAAPNPSRRALMR